MTSIIQVIKSLPKYLHIQIWVQRYIDVLHHDLHYYMGKIIVYILISEPT
jgi:hypothetical protein